MAAMILPTIMAVSEVTGFSVLFSLCPAVEPSTATVEVGSGVAGVTVDEVTPGGSADVDVEVGDGVVDDVD